MKHLVCLFFVVTALFACGKEQTGCMGVKPEDEAAQMMSFSAGSGVALSRHSSGIFYNIIDSGAGPTPMINSKISVTYTGKFLSGSTFNSSSDVITFSLNGVIEGWQIGIPLIKKGGRIKMVIPSALAYGCNGKPGIPPNSILVFDVSLVNVQ